MWQEKTDDDRSIIDVSIVDADGPYVVECQGNWRYPSAALSWKKLADAKDARWSKSIVVAKIDGVVAGYLGLRRCRMRSFAAQVLDPVKIAPSVFGVHQQPADSYLFIGASSQLVSGGSVAAHIGPASAHRVLATMVDAAFRAAAELGLTGAAVYVRDGQASAFRGLGGQREAVAVDTFAALEVLPSVQYLASLNHSRRSVVRRDWKKIEELGLRTAVVAVGDIVEEAAPLVAAVKQRHGSFDHPQLAQFRIEQWARDAPGQWLAFTVRDARGELLAVCFGHHHGDVLELGEIGLTQDLVMRQTAYVEAMVYAPLRFAVEAGCRVIGMGQGSAQPKQLRGAKITPVWAVGCQGREG